MEQNGNVRLTVIIVILLLIVLLYNFQSTDTVWYYLNDLDQEIISGGSYSEIQKSKIDIHLSRIDVFETTKNFKELLPTINYFYITGEVQREMEVVNIFIVENECVTHEKVTIEGLDNTIFVDVPESAEVYIGFNMPSFGYDWMLGVNENYNTTDFKVIQQKLERTELLKDGGPPWYEQLLYIPKNVILKHKELEVMQKGDFRNDIRYSVSIIFQ